MSSMWEGSWSEEGEVGGAEGTWMSVTRRALANITDLNITEQFAPQNLQSVVDELVMWYLLC